MTYIGGTNAFGGTGSLGPDAVAPGTTTGAPYRTTMAGATTSGAAAETTAATANITFPSV